MKSDNDLISASLNGNAALCGVFLIGPWGQKVQWIQKERGFATGWDLLSQAGCVEGL